MSLAVLKFLGYTNQEMSDMYFQLVYEQTESNTYRYVEPNHLEDSLPDDPGTEECTETA